MDKKTKEINTNTMQQCIADSEEFLKGMGFLEIEAVGFSFRNALQLEIKSEGNNVFEKEDILESLKKKMEEGINGTDKDFSEAYSTLLFAVRMLYAIHEHSRIIEWYENNATEEDEK